MTEGLRPTMPQPSRIILCRCDRADVVPAETRRQVIAGLAARGARFDAIPDLCELAARKDPLLLRIAESRPLWIVACRPRSVKWLFHAADAPLPDEGPTLLDMRAQDAGDILAALPESAVDAAPLPIPESSGDWVPWFPVIDRQRCENCKTCLNFCLFGVYGLDDGGNVRVEQPDKCKTYCPACARLCPEVAIIFPKYEKGPISGEQVGPEGVADEPLAVDPSRLAAGDVYAALRARGEAGGERFTTDAARQQAQAERRRHLLAMAVEGKAVVGIDQLISSLDRRAGQDAPEDRPRDRKERKPPDGEQE